MGLVNASSDAAPTRGGERVGLVLAGGGARGAYEVGALSELLPFLDRRGQRPGVLVGSSVGAINAAYLASTAHLSADESVAGLIERWRGTTLAEVIRPLVLQQLPLLAARLVGSLLSVPGVHLASLLDPTPVGRNLREGTDWLALRRNIDHGVLDAVAVLATETRTERTAVFCDSTIPLPSHHSHALRYLDTRLDVSHLQAAAAIPLLFPPAKVSEPPEAAGWYVDGGIRLNTPIKPALDLGVDRVVVIATGSVSGGTVQAGQPSATGEPPDLGDVALNLLHGKLVDPLVEDLRTLGNINTFFVEEASPMRAYREVRGKLPYRSIPYMFVGPRRRGTVGRLAAEVFAEHFGGIRRLRHLDLALLAELLGVRSHSHNELFTYLFFAPEFIDALIDMGARDARAWLADSPGPSNPWQLDPLDAFVAP